MNAASPADLEQANRRFHSVIAYLEGLPSGYQDINERTLRRWVKQFRFAEENYGCGYVGLLPRTQERGNRKPKAPSEARELLDKFSRSQTFLEDLWNAVFSRYPLRLKTRCISEWARSL